mgnify:CR=1 FL=1
MDSNILNMLREHFGVTEKYLSNSASTQTLTECSDGYPFLIPHTHKKNAKTLRQISEVKKKQKPIKQRRYAI